MKHNVLRENTPVNKSNKSLRPCSQTIWHFLNQNFQKEIKIGLSSPKTILHKTKHHGSTAKTSKTQDSNVHMPHIILLFKKTDIQNESWFISALFRANCYGTTVDTTHLPKTFSFKLLLYAVQDVIHAIKKIVTNIWVWVYFCVTKIFVYDTQNLNWRLQLRVDN